MRNHQSLDLGGKTVKMVCIIRVEKATPVRNGGRALKKARTVADRGGFFVFRPLPMDEGKKRRKARKWWTLLDY